MALMGFVPQQPWALLLHYLSNASAPSGSFTNHFLRLGTWCSAELELSPHYIWKWLDPLFMCQTVTESKKDKKQKMVRTQKHQFLYYTIHAYTFILCQYVTFFSHPAARFKYKIPTNSKLQNLERSLHLTWENLKWFLPAPYCSQKMA